jgi:signal transduction histidine kinase
MVLLSANRWQRRRVINKERALMKEKELKQARAIEKAYHELQTTQQQLIHAEKLASLGELTAGIAHEIQNPLNFVNNFSEVSVDLLQELEKEISKDNLDEAAGLLADLKQNLQKIGSHGKRASSIVRGMLDHSRANSGSKENTDLNLLALEYMRLAYHGFRAKDKSFNAYFMTDFDEELPSVRVVPQDIGRVLLNLFNNAFYAVALKSKQDNNGYSPTVTVSTKRIKDRVEIRVKDNGTGIPEILMGKIFQPFFTTKPAGDGTGLGLSLSYDIITKGHQGEMKVETIEGEGTEFIIDLPYPGIN